MTIHYNRSSEKDKRRRLRRNQTDAEELVWKFLRDRQMNRYKFRRQYSVDKFVIDFYCPKLKAAVELDGSIHDEVKQKDNDEIRQNYLERFGIKFLRIKNEELFGNPGKTFERIKKFAVALDITRPD